MREPWQDGDLMLVDNIRTAHSREAFEGPREVSSGWPTRCGSPTRAPKWRGILMSPRTGGRRRSP